ncbi:MAG: FtsX-like permease family protein, partial [Gemmatimonadales bacterium]
HVAVDHGAYPPDPGDAALWSNQLRHKLEAKAPGQIVLADDAFEPLTEASSDASNAKTLFILLGIAGALAAMALGLAVQSALAEAHRREDALLRLRGATGRQLVVLAAAQAGLAWVVGSVLGVLVAAGAVTALTGRLVWHDVPAGTVAAAILLAVAVGALTSIFRLVQLVRAGRRPEVVERRRLERGWWPLWRRAWLDLAAIGVGAAILAVDLASGGLKPIPIEPSQGSTLALRFYILLGLVFLWVGVTLLAVRGLLARAAVLARPGRAGERQSWRSISLRWLGRRPARTGVALVIGALAVAFGTQVVTFVATYREAKRAENTAAFGSNLRLTPSDPSTPLPALDTREVAAVSPIRLVPVRAGTDRKTILTLELNSYPKAATAPARLVSGGGLAALAHDPSGVLIAPEIAADFEVHAGDPLPLTLFPDDKDQSRNIKLRVAGVFRSFPPTNPPAEMVIGTGALPPYLLQTPDFYLARAAPGASPTAVARQLRQGPLRGKFAVTTISDQVRFEPRSLTALNLGPLGDLEAIGAALIASIGVAVLGAFLVLERRREFAILQSLGADASQIRAGPAQEGAAAVLGSIAIGVPVGLGLGVLSVRILGLFFTLPPSLLTLPLGKLIGFVLLMAVISAVALSGALFTASRVNAAATLREP